MGKQPYRTQIIPWLLVLSNKKHLKNVGPIRNCEPPHVNSPLTSCRYRYCRAPPAHRCPRRQRQRQRVTEGTAMAPWNGPNEPLIELLCTSTAFKSPFNC